MRSLQPSNRVRIGVMGALSGAGRCRGPKLHQCPNAFRPAQLLRAVRQHRSTEQRRQGPHHRRDCRHGGGAQDRRRPCRDQVLAGGNTIGPESRLAIKTDTILGKKVLEIEPRGSRRCGPGRVTAGPKHHPLSIYDAASDVTKAAAGWNIDTVKQSLNVLSQTVDQTYSHLSPALDGLARFSDAIGKRDERSPICSRRPTRWPAWSVTAAHKSTGCW